MNWERLKNLECPNCGQKMEADTDKQEHRCTACSFHIEDSRMRKIASHRSGDGPTVRMKWQNIRENRCPVCASELKQAEGRQIETMRCQASGCPFKIRKSSMEAIIADPTHPANKFYLQNKNEHQPVTGSGA